MFNLPQEKTKALIGLHGWSGVLLGLLLYAVVFTGAAAVLSDEIGLWSVGGEKPESPFSYPLNDIVSDLAAQVDPAYLEEVTLGKTARGDLQIFFHTHQNNAAGQLDDYGVQYDVDPETGSILQQRTGYATELLHTNRDLALSQFVVDVHTELHLPRPWGLLLTGILGLAMMVAAVSGFLMHRHLFADIFVLRRQRSELLSKRDAHTVAGTWGLPFAFILAFTGSFFSFGGAIGIPALAMVAFGGDQEALIRTVVGVPESTSDEKMQTHSIDAMIQNGVSRAGTVPDLAIILHYGRADAKVLLSHPAKAQKLEPIQLEYNGASGEFVRQKPSLGTTPSAGSAAFSIMGPLHFGNFAGLLSKFVWLALGFATCNVILSGLALWLKRREADSRWKPLQRLCIWMGVGLPLALSASAAGYYFSIGGDTVFWVPVSFLGMAAVVTALTLVITNPHLLNKIMLLALAVSLAALPTLRLTTGGIGWTEAINHHHLTVIMMDILFILATLFVAWLLNKNNFLRVAKNKNEIVDEGVEINKEIVTEGS